MENLNAIQTEIYNAIKMMSEKSSFTEFQIVKKIRENIKFDGKKKAGISLGDLLVVIDTLTEEEIFYSVHVNSVNECLLKKEEQAAEISLDAKQRRNKSEKSMEILTAGDITSKKNNSNKSIKNHQKRSERKKLSIYIDYDD